jgi:hypothetical protein
LFVEPLPAGLSLQLQAPQTFGLRLGAQILQQIEADVLVRIVSRAVGFERDQLALDESRDAGAIAFGFG